MIMQEVKESMQQVDNVHIYQCYREGNQADLLPTKDYDTSMSLSNQMFKDFKSSVNNEVVQYQAAILRLTRLFHEVLGSAILCSRRIN